MRQAIDPPYSLVFQPGRGLTAVEGHVLGVGEQSGLVFDRARSCVLQRKWEGDFCLFCEFAMDRIARNGQIPYLVSRIPLPGVIKSA